MLIRTFGPRRVSRRLLLLFAIGGACIAIPISVQSATAHYTFCTTTLSGFDHCDGSTTTLKATQAWDDNGSNGVCAGAVQNGSFYGSYACGNGFAEHCYAGSSLAPRIHNHESYSQAMHGDAYHGSEVCP